MAIEELAEYDVVVNVSDHFDLDLANLLKQNKIESHWFPLGESYQMPLENIYAAIVILWQEGYPAQTVLAVLCASVPGWCPSSDLSGLRRFFNGGKIRV